MDQSYPVTSLREMGRRVRSNLGDLTCDMINIIDFLTLRPASAVTLISTAPNVPGRVTNGARTGGIERYSLMNE